LYHKASKKQNDESQNCSIQFKDYKNRLGSHRVQSSKDYNLNNENAQIDQSRETSNRIEESSYRRLTNCMDEKLFMDSIKVKNERIHQNSAELKSPMSNKGVKIANNINVLRGLKVSKDSKFNRCYGSKHKCVKKHIDNSGKYVSSVLLPNGLTGHIFENKSELQSIFKISLEYLHKIKKKCSEKKVEIDRIYGQCIKASKIVLPLTFFTQFTLIPAFSSSSYEIKKYLKKGRHFTFIDTISGYHPLMNDIFQNINHCIFRGLTTDYANQHSSIFQKDCYGLTKRDKLKEQKEANACENKMQDNKLRYELKNYYSDNFYKYNKPIIKNIILKIIENNFIQPTSFRIFISLNNIDIPIIKSLAIIHKVQKEINYELKNQKKKAFISSYLRKLFSRPSKDEMEEREKKELFNNFSNVKTNLKSIQFVKNEKDDEQEMPPNPFKLSSRTKHYSKHFIPKSLSVEKKRKFKKSSNNPSFKISNELLKNSQIKYQDISKLSEGEEKDIKNYKTFYNYQNQNFHKSNLKVKSKNDNKRLFTPSSDLLKNAEAFNAWRISLYKALNPNTNKKLFSPINSQFNPESFSYNQGP